MVKASIHERFAFRNAASRARWQSPLFAFVRLPSERKSPMPFPMPRIRHVVPLSVLLFLHRKAPSCWPPLEYLPQQFQKNASHFEKLLISEPMSKPSTGPSRQRLCMKIDFHLIAAALTQPSTSGSIPLTDVQYLEKSLAHPIAGSGFAKRRRQSTCAASCYMFGS